MSVHVSIAATGRAFQDFEETEPTGARRGALAVYLPHMGLVLGMTASERERRHRPDGEPEGIVLRLERRCGGAPGGASLPARREADRRHAAVDDHVVRQLSQALEATRAEGGCGVYADALQLALVARMLAVEENARAALPPEVEPSAPARVKSGLVTWRLKRVLAFIEANLCDAISLADMARAAGLSRMHFAAQFRLSTGLRPHEYLLKARIMRAQRLMLESRDPLVQIALAVGFQTQAHFTTVFRRFAGATPHQWRSAQAAEV